MAENSKIEWTHHTFNPWRGCTKVSDGCKNCYAETLSGRNPKTLGVWGPNGNRVVAAESYWREPLKWDREAKEAGERRRVFCASLADVFEDWSGPMVDAHGHRLNYHSITDTWDVFRGDSLSKDECDTWVTMHDVRRRLFELIDSTPNLDWLLLTKRPENFAKMMPVWERGETRLQAYKTRPNIWLGVSVENQAAADERIPLLLQTPAAVRFLSCEPLLGPVDLPLCFHDEGDPNPHDHSQCAPTVDWVIVGGESGHGARPMHPDWARSIRDQCQAAGVAFFFKQWGEWTDRAAGTPPECCSVRDSQWLHHDGRFIGSVGKPPDCVNILRVGKKAAGRLLDGHEWNEMPTVAAHA